MRTPPMLRPLLRRLAAAAPLLLASAAPDARGAAATFDGRVWTYEPLAPGNACELVAVAPAEGTVDVPPQLGGLPVARLAASAFSGQAGLTALTLPGTMDAADPAALEGCDSLVLLRLPASSLLDPAAMRVPDGCAVRFYDESPALAAGMADLAALLSLQSEPKDPDEPVDPQTYAVEFRPQGGTGTMPVTEFVCGEASVLPPCAYRRTGCTFAGWSAVPGGPVCYLNRQTVRDLAAPGETLPLFAAWRPHAYTVRFLPNAGAGTMPVQTMTYGRDAALLRNRFTRPGCTFVGWGWAPSGGVDFSDGQVVRNLAVPDGARLYLYARWAVTAYTVRFQPNGGSGSMSDQAFTYGRAQRLRANAFRRTGHRFAGWARSSGGGVSYANGQSVGNLTTRGGVVPLYAKWTPIRYAVRFTPNGGSGAMPDQNFVYGQAQRLAPNAFVRDGCTFVGWGRAASGATDFADKASVNNLTATSGGLVRLYARWARTNYAVQFYPNGGTSGRMAVQPFTYGKSQALSPNAFVRPDHTFVGWSKTRTGNVAYRDGQSVRNLSTRGETVPLFAVWKRNVDPNLVVCLGDSITQGYRCAGDPYPTRLARLSGKTVLNYGVGGMKSSYGVSIVDSTLTRAPGTVCILFGANDVHGHDVSWTISNLRTIVRHCKAAGARPVLATPTPQRGDWSAYNSKVRELSSAIRKLAAEEGAGLADANAAFGSGAGLIGNDGLHLTDAGGSLLARTFLSAL